MPWSPSATAPPSTATWQSLSPTAATRSWSEPPAERWAARRSRPSPERFAHGRRADRAICADSFGESADRALALEQSADVVALGVLGDGVAEQEVGGALAEVLADDAPR